MYPFATPNIVHPLRLNLVSVDSLLDCAGSPLATPHLHPEAAAMLLSKADRDAVGAAVVEAANAKKPGAAFRLSEETRDTGGGLVLRRGRVELNCSFTEKLRQLRQEESSAVAQLLFD